MILLKQVIILSALGILLTSCSIRNIALKSMADGLGVGCLMDIFSATMVVVPLIIPISQVLNINPLQLGIIFKQT
jgi:hypothetical protein